MADHDLMIAIRIADLALDEEGRVIIRDPEVARQVAAAAARAGTEDPNPPRVNNCHGGNCVKGCGEKPK